ncbi:coth protein-domain-containing protein [Gongronella butleri]|nr:coth protein-domain-containing protein [Gongronella butleri]
MKVTLALLTLNAVALKVLAQDVAYSVIAFPNSAQQVQVRVNDQWYPLQANAAHPNLYQGNAPAPQSTYQYALTTDDHQQDVIEHYKRTLHDPSGTGHEFFNRSRTIYDVPALPQAYHPIYPPLFSPFNQSNEIATFLLQCNQTALDAILSNPSAKNDDAQCTSVEYISHSHTFKFDLAGINNSGKSSKQFAKQSFKIKFNEFVPKGGEKQYLFGRTTVKLRAHQTDVTYMREKLVMDMLGASGAATLQGSYVRVYMNGVAHGLYLMIDDATTSTINNMIHGGDNAAKTGPTYKGNALTPEQEGNLVFVGDNSTLYPDEIYEFEDKGRDFEPALTKENEKEPLVAFIKQLSTVQPAQATDENNKGSLNQLLDEKHTLIHLAFNFLTGSWDGVWYQASNYYLNLDPTRSQWTLISYDFDETLGVGAPEHFINTTWQNYTRPGSQRPLVDALLKSPYWAAQFDDVLRTVVKRVFKPSVIEPRLQVWRDMLRDDVAIDMDIPRSAGGNQTMQVSWVMWNYEHNVFERDGQNFGIAQWVRERSKALTQQLQFTDADDLPALGPYNGGSTWQANGAATTSAALPMVSVASKWTIALAIGALYQLLA